MKKFFSVCLIFVFNGCSVNNMIRANIPEHDIIEGVHTENDTIHNDITTISEFVETPSTNDVSQCPIMYNGHMYIFRDGKYYDMTGNVVKSDNIERCPKRRDVAARDGVMSFSADELRAMIKKGNVGDLGERKMR